MNTTIESYALLGSEVARDASVVERLRNAGAVILGKASVFEWYHFRSSGIRDDWSARRIQAVLLLFLVLLLSGSGTTPSNAFSIKEASVRDLQTAFRTNQLNSRKLVKFYIEEIPKLNPVVRGVIEVNPDALYQANLADKERKAKAPRSLYGLHGIPVLLEDNIATKDRLNTTAGSFALLKSIVPRDAGVVTKLRKVGAIILGKASLSEWANFRSINAPDGWSARAEATNGIGDTEKAALLNLAKLTRDGFEKTMRYKQLDAVVTPGSAAAPVLAIGGFPGITVPAGFDDNRVPFGITFGGLKGSEPKLIEIAYGFEQATQIRKPPSFKP
ncbi:Amidase [Actinidia chinensis var. chinensis]|uniref:Amidase n=1 Tax=Actinidia chinensis var. chinensis TaxID=1590841 RepID=A0A2R6QQ54_ACTCC|nr:Amidase [Actinidia chinensis var. chinensis]